jgi:hypothetical protein
MSKLGFASGRLVVVVDLPTVLVVFTFLFVDILLM